MAMVALGALYSFDDPGEFHAIMPKTLSSPKTLMDDEPRLLVEDQKGKVSEPLQLGASVEHASDGATLTIEGLPDDFEVSLGNRSDNRGWTVAATDLVQTFIGAPLGFVGVIETTATLRAANGRLLDRQILRLEWRANKDEPADAAKETDSAATAAVTPSTQLSSPESVGGWPPSTPSEAVTGEAIECQSSPPPKNKTHWAWRLVDNKKCWYAGAPGTDKSKLHWPASSDQRSEPVQGRPSTEVTGNVPSTASGGKHSRRSLSTVPPAAGWAWP